MAALGPNIDPKGESQFKDNYTLSQIASTIAESLHMKYSNRKPVAPAIDRLFKKANPLSAKSK